MSFKYRTLVASPLSEDDLYRRPLPQAGSYSAEKEVGAHNYNVAGGMAMAKRLSTSDLCLSVRELEQGRLHGMLQRIRRRRRQRMEQGGVSAGKKSRGGGSVQCMEKENNRACAHGCKHACVHSLAHSSDSLPEQAGVNEVCDSVTIHSESATCASSHAQGLQNYGRKPRLTVSQSLGYEHSKPKHFKQLQRVPLHMLVQRDFHNSSSLPDSEASL